MQNIHNRLRCDKMHHFGSDGLPVQRKSDLLTVYCTETNVSIHVWHSNDVSRFQIALHFALICEISCEGDVQVID